MDPRLNVSGPTLIVLAEFKDPGLRPVRDPPDHLKRAAVGTGLA